MNKRFLLTALAFFAIASLTGIPRKAGAQVLIPRTALLSPAKALPVVIARSEKDESNEHRRNMWRLRLTSDYGPVQTNTIGAQGTGAALGFAFTAQFPGHRFANTLSFTRYNTEFPRLQFCPACGGIFVAEDENDDYDEWDDAFDWFFGSEDCRMGLGVSYAYYHPVYEFGAYNMGGVGFGIDKFPSDRKYYSLYTHDYYYPNISGSYNNQVSGGFQILRFDVGLSVHPDKLSGLSYQLGLKGENWIGKGQNSRYNEINPYLGLAWSKF